MIYRDGNREPDGQIGQHETLKSAIETAATDLTYYTEARIYSGPDLIKVMYPSDGRLVRVHGYGVILQDIAQYQKWMP